MGRCREVPPDQDRLYLADVHKRAHDTLVEKGVLLPAEPGALPGTPAKYRPATADELADSELNVADALEDNDWIDVARRLNTGEANKAFTRMVKTMNAGERAALDPEVVTKSKIVSYLLGWSLLGIGEKPIPYDIDMPESARIKALNKLDVETFSEISAAIEAHEDAIEKESVARKKTRAGLRVLSRTPSSPSGSEDGHSMTSADSTLMSTT